VIRSEKKKENRGAEERNNKRTYECEYAKSSAWRVCGCVVSNEGVVKINLSSGAAAYVHSVVCAAVDRCERHNTTTLIDYCLFLINFN